MGQLVVDGEMLCNQWIRMLAEARAAHARLEAGSTWSKLPACNVGILAGMPAGFHCSSRVSVTSYRS